MLNKIQNQLIFGFLGVAIVPLLIMGISNHISSSSELRKGVLSKFNNTVNLKKNSIQTFLTGVKEDVFVIRDSPTLHNMLSASGDEYNNQRKLLGREFLAISQNKKLYYQVRYLDEKGMEVARVESDGTKSTVIPRNKLQNKSGRYYFKDTNKLDRGALFISPLDLNREKGKIEKPYKPVIRYATPVFHEGKRKGIVILNVFASKFLDPIEKLNRKDEYFMLFSSGGYYFSHPEKSKEWGGQAGLNTKESVHQDFSEKIASLLAGPGTKNIEPGDDIIFQNIFYPNEKNKDVYWKLARIIKKDIVFASLSRLLKIWIALLLIALVFAVIIALFISKTITEPILHLTEASEAISRGKLNTAIKIYGSSEIRTLGQTIKRLKESLEIAINQLMK